MLIIGGDEIRRQFDQINRTLNQLTKEIRTMTEEIRNLQAEVTAEGEEDVLTAQIIADLQAKLDEVQPLIDAAKAGEADALNKLEEVLAGVRQATEDLKADNPTEPEPEA